MCRFISDFGRNGKSSRWNVFVVDRRNRIKHHGFSNSHHTIYGNVYGEWLYFNRINFDSNGKSNSNLNKYKSIDMFGFTSDLGRNGKSSRRNVFVVNWRNRIKHHGFSNSHHTIYGNLYGEWLYFDGINVDGNSKSIANGNKYQSIGLCRFTGDFGSNGKSSRRNVFLVDRRNRIKYHGFSNSHHTIYGNLYGEWLYFDGINVDGYG